VCGPAATTLCSKDDVVIRSVSRRDVSVTYSLKVHQEQAATAAKASLKTFSESKTGLSTQLKAQGGVFNDLKSVEVTAIGIETTPVGSSGGSDSNLTTIVVVVVAVVVMVVVVGGAALYYQQNNGATSTTKGPPYGEVETRDVETELPKVELQEETRSCDLVAPRTC